MSRPVVRLNTCTSPSSSAWEQRKYWSNPRATKRTEKCQDFWPHVSLCIWLRHRVTTAQRRFASQEARNQRRAADETSNTAATFNSFPNPRHIIIFLVSIVLPRGSECRKFCVRHRESWRQRHPDAAAPNRCWVYVVGLMGIGLPYSSNSRRRDDRGLGEGVENHSHSFSSSFCGCWLSRRL
jgi:hypothetical protein